MTRPDTRLDRELDSAHRHLALAADALHDAADIAADTGRPELADDCRLKASTYARGAREVSREQRFLRDEMADAS